jgi:uncharacterized membrane protein
MDILKKATGWCKQLTEVGLAILALAVVLQVLFGANVAFFPVDVVGNIVALTKSLGSEGLVGLVALWILYVIFNRKEE